MNKEYFYCDEGPPVELGKWRSLAGGVIERIEQTAGEFLGEPGQTSVAWKRG